MQQVNVLDAVRIEFVRRMIEGKQSVTALAKEAGVSRATLYRWRALYAGLFQEQAERSTVEALEAENTRLRSELQAVKSILSAVASTAAAVCGDALAHR